MPASPNCSETKPTRVDVSQIETLDEALRVFLKQEGVREMIAFAGLMWFLRGLSGRPRFSDGLVGAGVAAFWPMQEWWAHKHLLHMEPSERKDPFFARAHRAHHRDPKDLARILLPREVSRGAMPAAFLVFQLLMPTRRMAFTALGTYATMAVVYEWTHYLVHTGYKPKSKFFARVRRNHHLHHYRNENNWFGFTIPHVDAWFGTDPAPSRVARSRTAMDLHGMNAYDLADESPSDASDAPAPARA